MAQAQLRTSTSPPRQVFVVSPNVILFSLGCIVTLTTTIYLTMNGFQEDRHHFNKPGVYGPIDADFDWCEYNHHLSPHLAEPWNSFTSLSYCIAAILAYQYNKSHLETRCVLSMITLFMIGIGSFCFHGTLTYRMQLLDELPMIYHILLSSWILYERNDVVPTARAKISAKLLTCFVLSLTLVLVTTPREAPIHEMGRIMLIFAFSGSFIYVFYAGSIAANEFETVVHDSEQALDMKAMFSRGFICIVFALLSWIGDNMACSFLHTLPVYPQLHAVGWHFGTCAAVYYMLLAISVQRLQLRKMAYRLREVPIPLLEEWASLHVIDVVDVKAV